MEQMIVLHAEHWTPTTNVTTALGVGTDAAALRAASIGLARARFPDVPADLLPEDVWRGAEGWAYLDEKMRRCISFRLIAVPVIGGAE